MMQSLPFKQDMGSLEIEQATSPPFKQNMGSLEYDAKSTLQTEYGKLRIWCKVYLSNRIWEA